MGKSIALLIVSCILFGLLTEGCAATPVATTPVLAPEPTVEVLPALHHAPPTSFKGMNTLVSCNDAGSCKRGDLSFR